jgi:hypothetical protein
MPWIDPRANARADLAAEDQAAKWARFGILGLAVQQLVTAMVFVLWYDDWIRKVIDVLRATPANQTPVLPPAPGSAVVSLLSLASLLGLVGVAFWTYRIVRVSHNLHYRNARSPALAAVAWIIPILQFWFPYQGVRDALPPGHPARRRIRAWWTFYLLGTILGYGAGAAGWFSEPVGLALCAMVGVTAGASVITGQDVIDAVLDHHQEAIGQVTGDAGRPAG